MNDKTAQKVHWSFWVIGLLTLLFNVIGVINFFVQITADSLEAFPEHYRPILENQPAWATAAIAIAVFGGAIGCVLLLLRKSTAFPLFVASLLGVVVTMVHIYSLAVFVRLKFGSVS